MFRRHEKSTATNISKRVHTTYKRRFQLILKRVFKTKLKKRKFRIKRRFCKNRADGHSIFNVYSQKMVIKSGDQEMVIKRKVVIESGNQKW